MYLQPRARRLCGLRRQIKQFFAALFVFIVAILIVAFLAMIVLLLVTRSGTNQPPQTKDWLELAGLLVAVLTSAASAGASYIIRRRQENQETRLADFTAEQNDQLAKFSAHQNKQLAAFAADQDKALAELKITLSQITSRRFEAYYAAWSGVSKYYRALKKLETGVYDGTGINSAIEKCELAEALSLLLDEEDRELFSKYWQTSNNVKESAENFTQASDTANIKDYSEQLWRENYKDLGQQFSLILEKFREKLINKRS
jgi:hypothetical protein